MHELHERASQVLADLARGANVEHRTVGQVLATITETAAATLEVGRVNVWLYDSARERLVCVDDFVRATGDHGSGAVLRVADSPRYFEALDRLRGVTAFDTHTDPRMQGLRPYLRAHGVSAMLDAPLLQSGAVVGVVCHEHVGTARVFDEWEQSFAGAIGDLVSLVLETDRRVRAERDRSRLSERLARREQVDSLGWVAAGVAHDFRNLLTIVFTNLEVLRAGITRERSLDDIERAAVRARDLCTLLLESSGQVPPTPARLDAPELLRDLLALTERARPANVVVDLDIPPGIPAVYADPSALQRIVHNLLTNAFESMPPEGGRITVSLSTTPPGPAPRWDFREAVEAPMVQLAVHDSGGGMEPATAARAGQPFFTTKTNGPGNGFGLSTVLGMVRGHHGCLTLETERGAGTLVRVWLPAAT
jgi:two-component system cell cycle sensor histidine kinase/response regulator CckA